MIKKFSLLVLTCTGLFLNAQSIDANVNYGINNSDFNHLELGLAYNFNNDWAIKADLASDVFKTDNTLYGDKLKMYRIDVQGVANLSSLIDQKSDYSKFNVLAHAGLGVTFGKVESDFGTDHVGNVILGVTPRLKVAENFYFNLDVTGVLNLRQHFDLNGDVLDSDNPTNNFVFNSSLGIIYRFPLNKK